MEYTTNKRIDSSIEMDELKELIYSKLIQDGFEDMSNVKITPKYKSEKVPNGQSGLGGDYYDDVNVFNGFNIIIYE